MATIQRFCRLINVDRSVGCLFDNLIYKTLLKKDIEKISFVLPPPNTVMDYEVTDEGESRDGDGLSHSTSLFPILSSNGRKSILTIALGPPNHVHVVYLMAFTSA